ncbi:unnamed protein product [Linum tenue]|uniref:Uncharacterized protein n=1 Tax=Linum tenue TaxID=586396 RepID=A0AAV0P6L3_9ROSI|nr:unnamed protein product [Linum tenue]
MARQFRQETEEERKREQRSENVDFFDSRKWRAVVFGGGDPDASGRQVLPAGRRTAGLKKKAKSCGGESKRSGRKVGRGGGNWHGEDAGTNFRLFRRERSTMKEGRELYRDAEEVQIQKP